MLSLLEAWNENRRQTAKRYSEAFQDLNLLSIPKPQSGDVHVWHQYVVTTPHRDALQAHLKAQDIETLIHYPIANHLQGAYSGHDFSRFDLSDCEKLVQNILSLPIDAFITEAETQAVIDAVRGFK